MKVSSLKINNANPRSIKGSKFKKLCSSIKDFPKMMSLRPIVIDTDGTILGGNMRYRALCELGYKEIPDEWVKRADELTDEEKQRFIIEDNVAFGDWDYDLLANAWDAELLQEWGVDLPFSASDFNVEDFFEEALSEVQKSTDEKIVIVIPSHLKELKGEITTAIKEAINKYEGVVVK